MKGLMGIKIGMTQVQNSNGDVVPVTVLEAGPCVVIQKKTADKDGYEAVQLGFVETRESLKSKAANGHFKKAGVTPKKHVSEFDAEGGDEAVGSQVTVSIFNETSFVDVSAVTKGKGFQGVVRRYGMRGGPMTHGGHSKRRIGSIGANSYPARVYKGKKMPGHMGATNVTVRGLEVVSVREEESLLLVKGAVPGPNGALVTICKSSKRKAGKA